VIDIPSPVSEDLRRRVARAEGQLRGIQRMLEEQRDCRDVVAQLSAVERAVQRARVRLIAAGIRYCATDPDLAPDAEEFERLLLRSS
jgi:DNA-binding FrmR family transcriptional regulator